METSRLWFYIMIALVVLSVFFIILVAEPGQDFPANLVHLLFRH